MDEFHSSLSAQHGQLERELDAVVAAGRAGCWPLYRRYLSGLREGLLQHMVFEEEALFPVLEKNAAAAVKALREEHAQLRRYLETLGAAAAEQDPAGCIAELGELGALLRSHHAAEMALDPQYAIRHAPRLVRDEAAVMDLRGLQPPEPIVRIFKALERNPGMPLRVILPHEPFPLYALLRERGFSHSGSLRPDGGFEVLIETA
jgi:hypothetical protein